MRVVFDHQCFQYQEHGGISRYIAELIRALRRHENVQVNAFLGINHSQVRVEGWGWNPSRQVPFLRESHSPRFIRALNQMGFAIWSMVKSADVYHATYYRVLPGPRGAARILTAYDCLHERFLKHEGVDEKTLDHKRAALQAADHIICISQQTRNDLIEYYNIPHDRMTVIYMGCSFMCDVMPITGSDEPPYLLFVGRRDHYKNFKVVTDMLAKRPALARDFMLICAGGPPLRKAEIPANVRARWIASPSDDRLAELYTHAAALIYPSRFEGFGLPVVEAMACGCPVITTKGGAIPEVAGDAAAFFDADDPDNLACITEAATKSSSYRARLIEGGRKQAAKLTWERCAEETLAVYARFGRSSAGG